MIVYKLFRVRKDNTLGSLFINRKEVLKKNVWLTAKGYNTKGYKYRPFYHVLRTPNAPHLSLKGRAWYKVRICDYQTLTRPKSQGGAWYLAEKMKILKKYEKH